MEHRRHSTPPPLLLLFKYADALDFFLIGVGSVAAFVDGLALPAMTLVQSHLIHTFGTQEQALKGISRDCLFFTYIALISWIATYLEVSCWMHAGLRQTERIRLRYLESVLRQDPTFFEDDDTTPEVINSIAADICLVQDAISEKAGNFIKNMAHFIGGYAVAFLLQWRIALLMTPFIPFLLLPGILYNRTILGFSVKMQASYERANAISEQALSSIRTVYSYVGEERVLKSYSNALQKVVEIGRKQGITKGLAMGSNGIAFLIWAFLGWYGAKLIASGEANGGQVLTTGFALMTGGLSLGNAVSHVKTFVDGRTAASKIFRIIDHQPHINVDDNTTGRCIPQEELNGKIEFRKVTFSYPSRPGIVVLKELSVEFSPGKTIALVGSSGSGKSTIISLIQRFYDPTSGMILLDDIDIKDMQLKWLRQNMGLVNQEPALFATSIKENILYGKENASMEEIIAAATLADAHSFISKLPNGYDTQVGERGIQMSGGQKQRIAIARAVLRNPSILLLDEATSALDTESEALVNRALRKASFGRTTILIAHRISTLRSADSVICLRDGSVANIWNRKELSHAPGGLNTVLLKMQQHTELPSKDSEEHEKVVGSNKELDLAMNEIQQKPAANDMKLRKPSLWRLLSFNRSEWTSGVWGLLGAVGYGLVQPFYAYLIGELASTYYFHSDQRRKQETRTCSFLFACLGIAFLMVNTVQHYSFAVLGENLTRHIRERMIQKLLTFEIGWFDRDEHASSIVCSRLASDANVVHSLIGDRISLLIQTASTILVSTILGLCTSWRLALVMIAIQPVVIQAYFYRKQSLANFAKDEARAQEAASQLSTEAVIMYKTVSSFCMQPKILSTFESRLEHIKSDMTRQCYKSGVCIGVAQFILYASWALDFWYGSHLVNSGESSAGDIFKTFFVLVSTGRMLAEAGTLSPDMAKGSAALEFISNVLTKESEIHPTSHKAEKVQSIKGCIEFRDVWFSYPSRPSAMVFQELNLEIKAGTSMAIVGQSGSGKSTILSLLERFYDPCEGKILIDGKDIRTMHLRSLRQHIALVHQEPSLFATSIRDNILYGRPNASEDEMIDAAKAANAHGFISALPDGYSTCVGTLGLQVSGGQKQRIAIARAFLKNPAILLLDEATSALDAESEGQVQTAIKRIMTGRTTIVIAHRLSTIKDADCISVLHQGCVVEQGNHSQLIERGDCGVYNSLVASQHLHLYPRHESE